jgi:glycosyltransferase involved in cell wall biosynthesis
VKLVLYPHVLEIGGSQLGAIDLAGALRDRGHEVVVFGQLGPLVSRIAELELEFVEAPRPRGRPSPVVMKSLCQLVRQRGIELVHGFEWTTAVEAYWGPRAVFGVPAIATVMSAAVAPFLPRDLPLIVGTQYLAAHEREQGRPIVHCVEPTVDIRHDDPAAVDTAEFRRRYELEPDALTIVCVTRLAVELKLEGLLVAIDTIGELARSESVQLVIVGDGGARTTLEERAARANASAGRRAVLLTGSLSDPRPAHAAADVTLGMGTSALRALAFESALIVQGEHGFWELLTPENEQFFINNGWYGIGHGADEGPARLRAALEHVVSNAALRDELGRRGRRLVETRFSLDRAAEIQLEVYRETIADAPVRRRSWLARGATSAAGLAAYRIRRRVERLRGRGRLDDFNAKPVAAPPSSLPGGDVVTSPPGAGRS